MTKNFLEGLKSYLAAPKKNRSKPLESEPASYIHKPGKRQADEAGPIVQGIKGKLKVDYRPGAIAGERQTTHSETILSVV
jgi:hypothetical protein